MEDNKFQTRLIKLLEALDMKPSQFATALGYSRVDKIYQILKQGTNPSFESTADILRQFPQINPYWLILGTGDMFHSSSDKEPNYKKLVESLEEELKEKEEQLLEKEKLLLAIEDLLTSRTK